MKLACAMTAALIPVAAALAGPTPPVETYCFSADSAFLEGCYDPCDCALFMTQDVRGTFDLRFVERKDPIHVRYRVSHVNFRARLGDRDVYYRGGGTYEVTGDFAQAHRMVLDLVDQDGAAVRFDSGSIFGGTSGPTYPPIDIDLADHEFVCFNRVWQVRSEPCEDRCRADWDKDGSVDSRDFFAFLQDFLGGVNEGGADFNLDGTTNSQDLFDFLAGFFAGCP